LIVVAGFRKKTAVFEVTMNSSENPALAIIDMQNDFVLPDSPCCVPGAMDTIGAIRKLADHFRGNEWPVIYVAREHRPDGSDIERTRVQLFRDGRGICLKGSRGAQIVEGLEVKPEDYVLVKKRFSAFLFTEFDLLLRRLGIETLAIAGTQYPNCIRSTAVDAMARDYRVVVVTDACSASSRRIADNNIEDMQNMGIECLPLGDLIE
jgi:nicotinamidase-related amidase